MNIRFATAEDVAGIIEAGRDVHAATRFRIYDYDVQRIARAVRTVIEESSDAQCLIVAEDAEGRIAGCLFGRIERHFFSERPVATLVYIGVRPQRRMSGSGLRLITAFRRWAENRGAFELYAGINSGADIERMDRFLKRLGFRLAGANYFLPLASTQDPPEQRRQQHHP